MQKDVFFPETSKQIRVSDSYQSTESSWMWQQSSSTCSLLHAYRFEVPFRRRVVSIFCLCVMSLSACEVKQHIGAFRSHNERPLSQTKREQTICAWWTLISLLCRNLCVMSAVGVLYSVLHGTFNWGAQSIHINIFLCSVRAFVELADYQKEDVGLVCLCYVVPC